MTENTSKEAGFSLIESLISLLISGMVMAGSVSAFLTLSKFAQDNELRTKAQLKAQAVLDMITPDIRMLGNGVPFHQPNFLIAQETLTDKTVTEPLRTSSTNHAIYFRLNETGETYILTQDFNPSLSTTISLTSVNKIKENSQIYITNFTVAEDDGLWAQVDSVNTGSNQITLKAGSQFNPGSVFKKGSLLEVVPLVSYSSGSDYSDIVRNNGGDDQVLVKNGKVTYQYLDINGNPLTLPLVASSDEIFPDSAIQNVRAVHIKVEVQTPRKLDGTDEYYTASVSKTVGIRNLNFNY